MNTEAEGTGLAARAVALELLGGVLRRGLALDGLLESHSGLNRLSTRDRGFARMLVGTVLRRLGQIDAVLAAYLTNPGQLGELVIDLLRLGVAQLGFLGVSPHAAVDTTVELAGTRSDPRRRGLVNAVLRRFDREGRPLLAAAAVHKDGRPANTPAWLWQSWVEAYGADTAALIATAHLHEAALDLSLKDGSDANLRAWAARLGATVLATGTLRLTRGGTPAPHSTPAREGGRSGDATESADGGPPGPPGPAGPDMCNRAAVDTEGTVSGLSGYDEGAWWIQDAAAALPVRLLGPVAGRLVYDLAAAPGGKTAQLASRGARVVAVDRSEPRVRRLRSNLGRLGLTATTVVADLRHWTPDAPADSVLVDAPCSGTGTIRRHPDIPHLKTPADVAQLARLQSELLCRAATMIRPGGTLVYATCSLQPEEGERQATALLAATPSVRRQEITAEEVPGLAAAITQEGDLRCLPGVHWADQGGIDGFFVARFVRAE